MNRTSGLVLLVLAVVLGAAFYSGVFNGIIANLSAGVVKGTSTVVPFPGKGKRDVVGVGKAS